MTTISVGTSAFLLDVNNRCLVNMSMVLLNLYNFIHFCLMSFVINCLVLDCWENFDDRTKRFMSHVVLFENVLLLRIMDQVFRSTLSCFCYFRWGWCLPCHLYLDFTWIYWKTKRKLYILGTGQHLLKWALHASNLGTLQSCAPVTVTLLMPCIMTT